jgi:hypothetical protein
MADSSTIQTGEKSDDFKGVARIPEEAKAKHEAIGAITKN